MTDEPDVLLTLPEDAREAFKDPLGPIETDAERLLADVDGPLITVGDVVTFHCEEAGRVPDVAVVDGRTKREAVEPVVEAVLAETTAEHRTAVNPAGTVTASLVAALAAAIDRSDPVQIAVEGEEDLAAVPAVLLAPDGASVVYGQPGEGMVHVRVDEAARADARALVERMDGDHERVAAMVPAAGG